MAFGHVATTSTHFPDRPTLVASKVHRNPRGGIQGSGVAGQGAESVLLSGQYEDDEDLGAFILYTGAGGRDNDSGLQVADQDFTGLNKTLLLNVTSGQSVRVIRKERTHFRYDGLYAVDSGYDLLGKRGYRICRFELRQLTSTSGSAPTPPPGGPAPRVTTTITRIARDTARSMNIKRLHDYRCQVCDLRLITKNGGYAEGAHIDALGWGGPDV